MSRRYTIATRPIDPHDVKIVLDAYRNASEQDKADGLAWYDTALSIADGWAATSPLGIDRDTAIDVIAIMSQENDWDRNLVEAHDALAKLDIHHRYTAVNDKALLAMYGYEGMARGPKIGVFRDAIAGDMNAVTIDRHMFSLFRCASNGPAHSSYYQRVVSFAARLLGLAPRDLQAIVWCWYRRTRSGDVARQHGKPEQLVRFQHGKQNLVTMDSFSDMVAAN